MKNPKMFSTAGPVEKDVTLADGSVEPMPFKKVGAGPWTAFQAGMASDDPEVQARAMMRLVKLSICEPDGSEALTMADVEKLDQDVMMSMFRAARDVNMGATPKKT